MGAWRKSSFSSNTGGDCVEVGGDSKGVMIRDTKQAHMSAGRTVLRLTREDFRMLTSTIKQNTI